MNRFRFVHLNVHSHYSINDGCASIKELVDAAIKDKMPGVAITDNGNMFGMMSAQRNRPFCALKLVLYLYFYITAPHHLCVKLFEGS